MDKKIYYISEAMEDACHAGSKARMDVERILSRYGLLVLDRIEKIDEPSFLSKVKHKASPSYLTKLSRLLMYRHKKCVLQYPFYFDKITDRVMKKFAEKNNVILVVHDVDSLRSWDGTRSEQEISFLNRMKVLIVHNHKMAEILKKLGVRCPMVELEVFDYLLPDMAMTVTERKIGREVAFAGNLYKSKFLQSNDIEKLDMKLNLYGLNFQKGKMGWRNVSYKGSYSSDEIPSKLQGSFGLIWDGDYTDTCSGAFGKYMLYNNPHKLSLYIAARLPIITWKRAAIAEFVARHNIGFSVASLPEMAERLSDLQEESYQAYIAGVESLRKKICSGFYFNNALQKALAFVE